MDRYKKLFSSLFLLSGVSLMSAAPQDRCAPEPGATCYPDDCTRCYCLGPENYAVNAPVRPKTCDGDIFLEVSAFYWRSYQDSMEYAVETRNSSTEPGIHQLIDADYKNPHFEWDFGFKLAVGYNSPCDGWDVSAKWTRFVNSSCSHVEAEADDNYTLLTLWSSFDNGDPGNPLFATDIETDWKLKLNLVDLDLGREFWVSKYVSLRPHIGVRVAVLDQEYNQQLKGGSWSNISPPRNGIIELDAYFKGAGIRAGLDSVWTLGCGFALYGDVAFSIINGRFNIDHDEWTRNATGDYDKFKVLETKDCFRSSKMITDLGVGIQWSSLICDCKYGLNIAFGYEQHLFFGQNQFWRVVLQAGDTETNNIYHHEDGDLSTEGWTFKVGFEF